MLQRFTVIGASCLVLLFGSNSRADGPCKAVTSANYTTEELNATKLPLRATETVGEAPIQVQPILIPGAVYARTMEVDVGEKHPPGELVAFSFWLIFAGDDLGENTIQEVEVSFCRGEETLQTNEISAGGLQAFENELVTMAMAAKGSANRSVHHDFVFPEKLGIDSIVYRIRWSKPEEAVLGYRFPMTHYKNKTTLRLPVEGWTRVYAGHEFVDHHNGAPTEAFAYDFIGVDEHDSMTNGPGEANESWLGWDRPIVAPAAGTVVDCRNDIPDNDPYVVPTQEQMLVYGDRARSLGGNFVTIDHGNGEYSFLGHLKKGTVTVETGDKVERGQVIGSMGNSGISGAPHLHYHLATCPNLLNCPGLSSRFQNVRDAWVERFGGEPTEYSPARGIRVQTAE